MGLWVGAGVGARYASEMERVYARKIEVSSL